MKIQDFEAMYIADLQLARDNAHALVKALPKLAQAAQDPELAEAFGALLSETSRQLDQLDQLLSLPDDPAAHDGDEAIVGLIAKALHVASETAPGPLRDAALIAAAQHIQHYEIATYGTLAAYAKILGRHDQKRILGAILEEERAIDEDLTVIAAGLLDPYRAKVAA